MVTRPLTVLSLFIGAAMLSTVHGVPMVTDGNTGASAFSGVHTQEEAQEVEIAHIHGESELKEAAMKQSAARRKIQTKGKAKKAAAAAAPARVLLDVVRQKDIKLGHQLIADETLRSIDRRCREKLKTLYVRYDNPEHRGLGGGSTIILSGNVPDGEFRALLVHECGHVIDTGAWQGTTGSGLSSFADGAQAIYQNDPSLGFYLISWTKSDQKKKGWSSEDFVSGYASWNAFEDFAETFAYYTLHRDEFYVRAQKNATLMAKYRFMETQLEKTEPAKTMNAWGGDVPWDITKLSYMWLGGSSQLSAR